jgi:hypothetical protein
LNRLAEANFVGHEYTSSASDYRQRGLELVRQDHQISVNRRRDRANPARRRDLPGEAGKRMCRGHTRWPAIVRRRRRPVEWREKRAAAIAPGDVVASHAVLRAHALDPPALLPNARVPARREAIGLQKLPPCPRAGRAESATRRAPLRFLLLTSGF